MTASNLAGLFDLSAEHSLLQPVAAVLRSTAGRVLLVGALLCLPFVLLSIVGAGANSEP